MTDSDRSNLDNGNSSTPDERTDDVVEAAMGDVDENLELKVVQISPGMDVTNTNAT